MTSLLQMSGFFRRNAPQGSGVTVQVGDRFFKPGQRTQIWTVERVFKPVGDLLPHVVLKRGGENPETYVISTVALMNPHMFRRDRRDPEAANVSGRARRAMDYVKSAVGNGDAHAENEADTKAEEHGEDTHQAVS